VCDRSRRTATKTDIETKAEREMVRQTEYQLRKREIAVLKERELIVRHRKTVEKERKR
jgi:hypothetical protein